MGSPTISRLHEHRAKLDQFSPMLSMIPEGYYAVRRDDVEGQIDFLRVTFPTKGQFKGTMKVQSQHSDQLRIEIVIRLSEPDPKVQPFSRITWIRDVRYCDVLFAVLPQINQAAMLYAQAKHVCCICGKKLTDERSRYYGIGPECEESHYDYIEEVESVKGEYFPGATLDW